MLTISPERRILILLAGMIGGIALVLAGYGGRDLRLAGVLAAALICLGSVIRMRRAGLRLDQSGPIAVITQMLGAGVMIGGLAAWVQMAPIEEAASRESKTSETSKTPETSQARLQDGLTTIISGEIIRIDGRSEGRLRFWIRLTTQPEPGAGAAPGGWSQNERQQNERAERTPQQTEWAGEIVRVSFDAEKAGDVFWRLAHEAISARQSDQRVGDHTKQMAGDSPGDSPVNRAGDRTNGEPYPRIGFTPGDVVQARVRLYPPPGPLLPGAPDFAMQARAKNVVASGYVVRFLAVQPGPEGARWLARFRHKGADRLVAHMTPPAGGIAAALLVGDRRHISGEVYEMFQRSGLAHLLAISGLHMGLLCFGVIQLVRFAGAMFPGWAAGVALHKYAAVVGLFAGAGYVLISGMPISALRAFIMAGLLIAALLLDRLALTVRNVALAAMIILALNPAALFTASFQLSFAATAALVLWYEARMRQANDKSADGRERTQLPRVLRYVVALSVTSLIAGAATLPFAAQHFGMVTIWGVAANLLGIPLTGLWIMPAGLVVGLLEGVSQLAGGGEVTSVGLVGTGLVGTGLEGARWVMETGILVLVAVAEFFAGLPYAGWRLLPPGYALLCLGLGGWLLALLDARRGEKGSGHEAQNAPLRGIRLSHISRVSQISHIAKSAGVMLMVVALVMWALTPAPDGALLARGRTPILVLAGPNGQATQIAPSTPRTRRTDTGGGMLSDFTKSTASLLLAQEIIDPVTAVDAGTDAVKKPTMSNSADDRRSPIMLLGRHGQKLAVARHRAALTRACRSGADLVLSFAAPRYACQVPVFTVTRL